MPSAFCFAGRRSIRACLSARLPTPAAFATTLILHENFAIGSVAHRAHTLKDTTPLATKQCTRVLLKVRHRLTTPIDQRSTSPPRSADLLEQNGYDTQPGPGADIVHARRRDSWKLRAPVRISFSCIGLARAIVRGRYGLPAGIDLSKLIDQHGPAAIGIPVAAVAALFLISLTRALDGPMSFDLFGLKSEGAAATCIIWAILFLVISLTLRAIGRQQ
jgi:hypothetical protein